MDLFNQAKKKLQESLGLQKTHTDPQLEQLKMQTKQMETQIETLRMNYRQFATSITEVTRLGCVVGNDVSQFYKLDSLNLDRRQALLHMLTLLALASDEDDTEAGSALGGPDGFG
jgi:hypothetical protein